MRIGSKVLVYHPNRHTREHLYWQPFEILGIRKQATGTIVRLRGLILPNIEITGEDITSLSPYRT